MLLEEGASEASATCFRQFLCMTTRSRVFLYWALLCDPFARRQLSFECCHVILLTSLTRSVNLQWN